MPRFLVEETTVRESGESPVLSLGDNGAQELALTLEITHVKQYQELDVHVFASEDGVDWPKRSFVSFLGKTYCGTYKVVVPHCKARFMKAVWRVNPRGRDSGHPVFRFHLKLETAGSLVMAGAA